jgi:hypothetical protein
MDTEGRPKGWKGVRMRNQKLRTICPSGAFCPEVRVSRTFFLVQKVALVSKKRGGNPGMRRSYFRTHSGQGRFWARDFRLGSVT